MIPADRPQQTLGDLIAARRSSAEPAAWTLIEDALNSELVACFEVPGEPVSKERARVPGKGEKRRAYTPEKTREAERAIAWAFRRARPGWGLPDPDGTYGVYGVFFVGDHRRRDGDNMIKLVLDAFSKVVWADDCQALDHLARVVRGVSEPHSTIVIYRVRQTGRPASARTRKRAAPGQPGARSASRQRTYDSPRPNGAAAYGPKTADHARPGASGPLEPKRPLRSGHADEQ